MKNLKTSLSVMALATSVVFASSANAALSNYGQDFESLDAVNPYALGGFGANFRVSADVWGSFSGDATVGTDIFVYDYGQSFAPNGGPSFSAVAGGEGGFYQGSQYLNVYSDYNNPDQTAGGACGPTGCTINTSVFQQQTIGAGDVGKLVFLIFDAKSPFAGGIFDGTAANGNGGDFNNPQSASAFIKTLDPSSGYATTNDIRVDMTGVSNTDWGYFAISLYLADPLLAGQILQFGFNTVSTENGDSGVYYDNIEFRICPSDFVSCPSIIPIPAAAWLFGSGLLGLIGVARRKKS